MRTEHKLDLRLLLLVTRSQFSANFVARLSARGVRPALVVCAGQKPLRPAVGQFPVEVADPLERQLTSAGLAFAAVRTPARLDVLLAREARFDLGLVACFPWRLKLRQRAATEAGFINVHPSLLPKFRGPDPISEQLSAGDPMFGVSLHWVDAGIDTGNVLLQARWRGRQADSEPHLNRELAWLGADMVSALLTASLLPNGGRSANLSSRLACGWPQPVQ